MLPPLQFEPIIKRALWGGRRLGTELGKPIGEGEGYSESWEVTDLRGNVSVVASGPLAGVSLRQLVETQAGELLGVHQHSVCFPLLIKFLDAREKLSVQVHPSQSMAARRPEVTTGKAETWIVMAADEGALIYAGLKPGVDATILRAAIEAGHAAEALHSYPVQRGDCISLLPGTVHALGGGLLVAEVQQPNDVTYRLDDWNRVGPDGHPRELHLELGMEATNFDAGQVDPVIPVQIAVGHEQLVVSPYFCIDRLQNLAQYEFPPDNRMHVLMGLEGQAELLAGTERFTLIRGATLVLPAQRSTTSISIPPGSAIADSYLP